jgi:transcriptional regulator with XRE-family HTH domain
VDQEVKKLIGMRVRTCRQRMEISQEGLANKLGMKRTNVANYEAGRVVPPGSVLLQLSEIFNVTTDYLLGLTDDPEKHTGELDEDLMQIQRAKKKLKGKDREKIERMVEMIKLSFIDATSEDDDDDDDDI